MPYGRSFKRKSTARTSRPVTRSKRVAAPAKRKTVRSYVRKNAVVNARQSRQIRTLYRLRYGSLQQNFHETNVSFSPTTTQPLIVNLNDFSCFKQGAGGTPTQVGCQVLQVSPTGNELIAAARWNPTQVNNPLWQCNKDEPDTGKYLIEGANYRFRMIGNGRLIDTRVTFTLVRQKAGWMSVKNPLPGITDTHQTTLPFALVNYTGLTGPVGNRINPMYHQVISQKTFYFNSDTDDATTGSTQITPNVKWANFYVPKHRKPIYQRVTNPGTPGFVEPSGAIAGESPWSAGQEATDVRQGCFLIISCSARRLAPDAGSVSITADRVVKYRDSNGSAKIY